MTEAQKAKVRVLLCGTIPDPRPAVDSRLKNLDEALKDLEMGEGNKFVSLRGSLLDAEGQVRKDIFKPRGDIHLNVSGTQIVSMRIQQILAIMLPSLVSVPVPAPVQAPPAPVQTPAPAKVQRTRVQAPVPDPAPVAVNTPPVVGATLVAEVVNVPVVVNAPVVETTPMEVEDEDTLLERLFFKKYGRALPEPEKEKDVDINFVIDLTDEKDEMEVETPAPVVVVKTEPNEVANVNNFANAKGVYNESGIRVSRRLELIELAKARKAINEFGKSLRKTEVIQEKEAPLAAGTSEDVIAAEDTDMAEANSVAPVSSVTSVNVESGKTYEEVMAEIDAAIEDNSE
jgi:hypothetical protein